MLGRGQWEPTTAAQAPSEPFALFARVHEYTDEALLKRMVRSPERTTLQADIFQQVVLGHFDTWQRSLDAAKALFTPYEKQRVIYDHYREKLADLCEEQRKLDAKGQRESKSQTERRDRVRC